MKRAIVLSGGGSKGAYQIGAWKALRQLKITYDIVTGTSVGALNGAMMVQNSFHKSVRMWQRINFEKIFDKDTVKDLKNFKDIYKMYAKNAIGGGIKPLGLEKIINHFVSENMVRNSRINYGLVTVKFPTLKPLSLSKEEIPKGKLKDYLIASATCFPAFKTKTIDDQKYIDGGYYDNMPVNLAVELGAEEIIAVDLNAIGVKRSYDESIKITHIYPKNDLGSFLVFDPDTAIRNIAYGYNDTLKAFGELDGDKYSFKKGHLELNFNNYNDKFNELVKKINSRESKILNNRKLKELSDNKKESFKTINETIEYLGQVCKLDDARIYRINTFNNLLLKKINRVGKIDLKRIEKSIKDDKIKDLLHTKTIVKYIYDLINQDLDDKTLKKLLTLAKILPKDFMGALYLSSIKYRWF